MNQDPNNDNQQLDDLENNPFSQAESQAVDKMVQQVQNVTRNISEKAKKATQEALKKIGKAAVKAVIKLGQLILKLIMATAPVSLIIIGVVIVGILIMTLYMESYSGSSSVLRRDIEAGDADALDQNVSLYETNGYSSNTYNGGADFDVAAGQSIVATAQQIHDYIRTNLYSYRNGNTMNYPTTPGEVDRSGGGIDCSTYITWILIMNGYTEFKGKYQLTTYDFIQWIKGGTGNYDLSHYGWTWQKTSDSNATINEGDLLLKTSSSAHIELYAGNGTYNAGSTNAIRRVKSYVNCSKQRIVQLGNFDYIIKINKKN